MKRHKRWSLSLPCEETAGPPSVNQREVFTRTRPDGRPDLGLSASRTVNSTHLPFKKPCLCCCVRAAGAAETALCEEGGSSLTQGVISRSLSGWASPGTGASAWLYTTDPGRAALVDECLHTHL